MKAVSMRSNVLTPMIVALVLILCLLRGAPASADRVYDSKSFPDLYAAVAAIGKTNALLHVTGRNELRQDLVIPGNVTLRFLKDGILIVEKGKALTIESPVQAPKSRIFDGNGVIILKSAEVYPQWWGAKGDGISDDGHAIQAAIDSVHAGGGGVVRLPVGTYLLNHITGGYYALKSKSKVSVVGEGTASVLKAGNNLRTAKQGVAVLYNHEEPVSQCRYAHFTVDYNGKNNLRLASWGDARASNVSRLGAEYASDVIVEDVHFRDVTGAHCVYFGNQKQNHHNTVRNCTVTNVGRSVPGNQLADHSSIYIGGTQGAVTGNVFLNQAPCDISTAIEVHSSDTVVSNNMVTNYATAMNIGGEANDCVRVTVKGNTFKNCRNGIVFWHFASFVMNDMTITGNSISLRSSDNTPYPSSMGIIYGNGYVTSKANMRGLTISGNTIYQESTASGMKPNTAIMLLGVDLVTISSNTIYDISGEAIYMESRSASQSMKTIRITGNSIRNVGYGIAPDRKRGIAFNSYGTLTGAIDDIAILDNRIESDRAAPMKHGITFNNGSFPLVDIRNNVITGAVEFDILRSSDRRGDVFRVDHRGKGSPVNILRAADGSQWLDAATGRIYTASSVTPGGWIVQK